MAQRIIQVRVTVEVEDKPSYDLLQRLVTDETLLKVGGQMLGALKPVGAVLEATVAVCVPKGNEWEPEVVFNLTRRTND